MGGELLVPTGEAPDIQRPDMRSYCSIAAFYRSVADAVDPNLQENIGGLRGDQAETASNLARNLRFQASQAEEGGMDSEITVGLSDRERRQLSQSNRLDDRRYLESKNGEAQFQLDVYQGIDSQMGALQNLHNPGSPSFEAFSLMRDINREIFIRGYEGQLGPPGNERSRDFFDRRERVIPRCDLTS